MEIIFVVGVMATLLCLLVVTGLLCWRVSKLERELWVLQEHCQAAAEMTVAHANWIYQTRAVPEMENVVSIHGTEWKPRRH